jgi:hypothetical protein
MVQCVQAYMDFCYIARRPAHDTSSLAELEAALDRFFQFRAVFIDKGIREHFALPRQHALVHYTTSIRLYGSPNGLCSSITESKHIKAVKEPWRRSSRRNPLSEILRTISRLDKLSAARTVYGSRGLLGFNILDDARRRKAGLAVKGQSYASILSSEIGRDGARSRSGYTEVADVVDVDGDFELLSVQLANMPGTFYFKAFNCALLITS